MSNPSVIGGGNRDAHSRYTTLFEIHAMCLTPFVRGNPQDISNTERISRKKSRVFLLFSVQGPLSSTLTSVELHQYTTTFSPPLHGLMWHQKSLK